MWGLRGFAGAVHAASDRDPPADDGMSDLIGRRPARVRAGSVFSSCKLDHALRVACRK